MAIKVSINFGVKSENIGSILIQCNTYLCKNVTFYSETFYYSDIQKMSDILFLYFIHLL